MVKIDHFLQNKIDHASTMVEAMYDSNFVENFSTKFLLQSPHSLYHLAETVYQF